MNRSQQLTLFGAILLIFSLFLPWATHTAGSLNLSESINGYATDGVFTGLFGLALILIAVVVRGKPEKTYSYFVAVLAFIAFSLTLRTITSVGTVIRGSADITTSIQIGTYLSIVGAILSFVGGIMKVPPAPNDRKTIPPHG